jgi:UDP-N-acetylglucosamine 2-epimerase (non-hydrolysing)/GDP/UDP-N,N'-diacetylbacillosamine 2-epimerase (hydrolysing)
MESRATYGYSRNVIRAMREFGELDFVTLVTGGHLEHEFGRSVELIEAAGLPVSARVPLVPRGEGRGAWSRAMGEAMAGFAGAFEKLAPDIVLISGDRAETLTLCVTAAYMGLPVAHIQAGDKSGHIDDAARYAIAKLAHIHFAACDDAAIRLRRLGEQDFRIFVVGAPQLDDIVGRNFRVEKLEVAGRYHDLSRPYILLMQHPVLTEIDDTDRQMTESLRACLESGLPIYWIYPNSDFGYRRILAVAERGRNLENVVILPNLDRDDFLTLLANSAVLVGNSSTGILEAPSFRVPVVNIGTRQRGRPQASNILNCGYEADEVSRAIQTALHDPDFRAACGTAVNQFGDGQSGPRIARILSEIAIDKALLDKQCAY